ncbi:MAG: DNA polymerase III subunit delta [Pelovirga sp.]
MRLEDFYRQLEISPPALILLYGEESYLVEQTVRRIRATVIGADKDDFNDHHFSGKGTPAEAVMDTAYTYPVFAPRKLVTVHGVDLMPAHEQEKLSSYLDQPAPETSLLLVAEKIDNRRKFFQQFKKKGVVLKFDPLTDREIPDFVRRDLEQRGVRISRDALDLFCSLLNNKLHEVEAEIAKLVLFVGEHQQISVTDVEAIVSRGRTENIFELGTAIGRGDLARALILVRRFAAAAEPPLLVLNLITGHYRLLWKIRSLQSSKASVADIAKRVARPPFVVKRLLGQGSGFTRRDFINAYHLFVATDLAMKSSGGDPEALLEQMVIGLIRDKQKRE